MSKTLSFREATAVEPAGDGAFRADLRQEYAIGGAKPNGGYLLACLGRAALETARAADLPHAHIIGAGAQYLASPDNGPGHIATAIRRTGRTASQIVAAIANGEAPGVEARFTLATLPADSKPYWGTVPPVELPDFADCTPMQFGPERGITVRFDPATSFHQTDAGFRVTGDGEFRAWFVNDDEDAIDPIALLFASDCLPPATAGVVMTGWVPTLDMTVYIRALPAPGPIRLRFRVQMIQDGFANEICEAWDSRGALVMQSTELVALRLPS